MRGEKEEGGGVFIGRGRRRETSGKDEWFCVG